MPSNHYCREFFDRAAPSLYKQEWQEGMNEAGYSRPNHHEAERQRCPHVFQVGLANGFWMVPK